MCFNESNGADYGLDSLRTFIALLQHRTQFLQSFLYTGSARRIFTLLNKQRKQFIYVSKVNRNIKCKNTIY
jgi:hypothetical protein